MRLAGMAATVLDYEMARRRPPRFELSGLAGFLAVSSTGVLLITLVCFLAPVHMQIAAVGVLVVLVLSLTVVRWRQRSFPEEFEIFNAPISLARDQKVFDVYRTITSALVQMSVYPDPIYRDLALERTEHVAREVNEVAEGRIIFTGTETWRMAYDRLLQSPGLLLYRSVAHVRTSTYWQDEPGRQSMQLNFQMVGAGTVKIERIAIFPDHLWPAGERFPVEPLGKWIDEQYNRGISVRLVRQSAIATDAGLIADLGIYGTRAVGFQELDDQGRTARFTLSFDFADLLAAEQRWERLSVYPISYQKLLDQSL